MKKATAKKTTKTGKTAKPAKATKPVKPVDLERVVKKTAEELLSQLGVTCSVTVTKGDEHFALNLETSESGLIIGRHGEVINSLQLLLGVILYKKTGQWMRVVVDVGGYRQSRQDNISEMVGRIVKEVEANGVPVTLPPLTPFERRTIHLMLSDHEQVVSESVGEGRDRRLVIKPRS